MRWSRQASEQARQVPFSLLLDGLWVLYLDWCTHRLHSSSFLGLPYRILNINHRKGTTTEPMGRAKRLGVEGLLGLWVFRALRWAGGSAVPNQPCSFGERRF